jgi:hypothetical protein
MKWFGGLVFLAIGVTTLVAGACVWRSQARFAAAAVHADGVVVDNVYRRTSKGGSYRPAVEFTTPSGRAMRIVGEVGSASPSYARGAHVRLLYDPAHPEQARIDSFTERWLAQLVLLLVGVVFTPVGLALVVARIRAAVLRRWLVRHGTRVQARFGGVERDASLRVNGRNPWRIACEWTDPTSHKAYMFRSESVWFDPAPFVHGDLEVWINPADPTQHFVDLSFLRHRR